MPVQFGGKSIGAMQYNGKNIVEAMIDGKTVWSAEPPSLYTALGAFTWLDFTDGLTDKGSSPAEWSGISGTPVVQNGHLVSGRARRQLSPFTYDVSAPLTMSGWFKPYGSGTSASETMRFYGGFDLEFKAEYRPSDRNLWWRRRNGSNSLQTYNAGQLSADWSFIAAVMEPVSGNTWRFRCYLNGAQQTSTTWDAGTPPTLAAYPIIEIGNAYMDDFAMFPSALSASDIQSLYQAGRST